MNHFQASSNHFGVDNCRLRFWDSFSVQVFVRQVCLKTLWGATCWRRFARSCQSPGRSLSLVKQHGDISNGICLGRLASGNVPWRCFVCVFFGLLEGNAMEWVCFQVFQVLPTQLEASRFKGLMNSAHSQPRHTSALWRSCSSEIHRSLWQKDWRLPGRTSHFINFIRYIWWWQFPEETDLFGLRHWTSHKLEPFSQSSYQLRRS